MGIKEDLQKLLSKEKHQTIIDKLRSNHIKISPSQKEEICTLLILLVLLGVKKIETAADEKSLGDFLVAAVSIFFTPNKTRRMRRVQISSFWLGLILI